MLVILICWISLLFPADINTRPHSKHYPSMKRQHVAVNLGDKKDLSEKEGADYDIVKHEDDMIKENLLPTIKDMMMQQALVKTDESSRMRYPGTMEEQVLPAMSAMKFTGGGVAEEANMQQLYKSNKGLENQKSIDGINNGLLTEGFSVGNKENGLSSGNDKMVKLDFTKTTNPRVAGEEPEQRVVNDAGNSRHNVFQDSVSFHDGFVANNRANDEEQDDDDEMEHVSERELAEPKTKPLVSFDRDDNESNDNQQSHLDDTSKRHHTNLNINNQKHAFSSSPTRSSSNKKSNNGSDKDNGVVSHVLEAVFGQQDSTASQYGVRRESLSPSMSMFLPSRQIDQFSQ